MSNNNNNNNANKQNEMGKKAKFISGIRSIVSKDNVRIRDDSIGVDLDLTYITDRIIAMGYPAESITALFRNSINDVAKYLETKHQGKYMVYNLVSSKEGTYDYSKFRGKVQYYGWDDNHAPSLSVLCEIIQSIDAFLAADPANVVAIHCKAGRGRTGTVISSYLLHSELHTTASDSISFFAHKRSKKNEKEFYITTPSQTRYFQSLNLKTKL